MKYITILNNCFLFKYIFNCNLYLWYKAEFLAAVNMLILIFRLAAQEKNIINVENVYISMETFFLLVIITNAALVLLKIQ